MLDMVLGKMFVEQCKHFLHNISAKKSSRSDWGSNARPTATPPSTKYQSFKTLWARSILKKNGSLDSGIQAWYLSTRHVAN
jgi:hypothetical protein